MRRRAPSFQPPAHSPAGRTTPGSDIPAGWFGRRAMTGSGFRNARAIFAAGTALGLALAADIAWAQEAADTGGGLEEIVVTARKREESMQDVPASISALSAGELA